MRIHCIEMMKLDEMDDRATRHEPGFSLEEVKKMVGFVEPIDVSGMETYWQVTMMDGGFMDVKDQTTAYILANTEEIKAMLALQRREVEDTREQAQEALKGVMGMIGNPMMAKVMGKMVKPPEDKEPYVFD